LAWGQDAEEQADHQEEKKNYEVQPLGLEEGKEGKLMEKQDLVYPLVTAILHAEGEHY
jgi:hypothetical protein